MDVVEMEVSHFSIVLIIVEVVVLDVELLLTYCLLIKVVRVHIGWGQDSLGVAIHTGS